MFFKVTLTLVLLVQITYQGKQMSKRNLMLFFDQSSNDYFGHNKSRNARQFERISKWFDSNDQNESSDQTAPQKSRFYEVMSSIASTPDYGLKFTEEKPRINFPGFPGFHNLIEVRGPIPYRYVPNKLKEQDVPRIHNQNKSKMKTTSHDLSPESSELRRILNQLDEIDFSKEAPSIWDNSHESYKRSPGSDLVNNMKPSTPMLKFYEGRQYTTKVLTRTAVTKVAKVTGTPSIPNIASFAAPDLFEKIDPLPFKQVKTRNQDTDSDEDEDDERTKYLEYY